MLAWGIITILLSPDASINGIATPVPFSSSWVTKSVLIPSLENFSKNCFPKKSFPSLPTIVTFEPALDAAMA